MQGAQRKCPSPVNREGHLVPYEDNLSPLGERILGRLTNLFFNTLLVKYEGILEGGGLQSFEASRCSSVAGSHVDVHDQDIIIGLHVAQLGNPFGRLPVLHL